MIVGQVTAGRDAIIRLPIKGPGGDIQTVDAIVDTGFSEYLTLPASRIASLALPLLNATAITVAGGGVIMVEVYEAAVVWDGADARMPPDGCCRGWRHSDH